MMNKMIKIIFCTFVTTQVSVCSVSPKAKSVGKSVSAQSTLATGIIFQGIAEQGISKDTFLCGDTSVTAASIAGTNFESSDCSINNIQDTIGFDISGGKTIQFFNDFTYWIRQKSKIEQDYQINNPGANVASYMSQQGWSAMGAFCILISTNSILQEIVGQAKQAGSGKIKVVAQLWYNGDNLIQLWSQDVAIMEPGQSFIVNINNSVDADLLTTLQNSATVKGYLSSIGTAVQPSNRNMNTYNAASDSPRTIRIKVS